MDQIATTPSRFATAIHSLLSVSHGVEERVLLEPIPSAGPVLATIIQAMKESVMVQAYYRRYGSDKELKSYTFEPYCVKLFRQRWYVLAHFPGRLDRPYAIFSVDRVEHLELTGEQFAIDPRFNAEAFFADYFGAMVAPAVRPEKIVLRAYGREPYYLRHLPIHPSQRELESTPHHTDFEVTLRPTADFAAAIMQRGGTLAVISPHWLAIDMLERARSMVRSFSGDNDEPAPEP